MSSAGGEVEFFEEEIPLLHKPGPIRKVKTVLARSHVNSLPTGVRTESGLLVHLGNKSKILTDEEKKEKKEDQTRFINVLYDNIKQERELLDKANIPKIPPVPKLNTNNANGIFKNCNSVYVTKPGGPKKRGRKPNNPTLAATVKTELTEPSIPKKRNNSLQDNPAKRQAHNMMERDRRSDIKVAFMELKDKIPTHQSSQKCAKVKILCGAYDHIQKLEEINTFTSTNFFKALDRNKDLMKKVQELVNRGRSGEPVGRVTKRSKKGAIRKKYIKK